MSEQEAQGYAKQIGATFKQCQGQWVIELRGCDTSFIISTVEAAQAAIAMHLLHLGKPPCPKCPDRPSATGEWSTGSCPDQICGMAMSTFF
jgi:hypothetical protein